ncbi:MAG: hypothetical protein KatS3mg130_1057 [Candidatus Sumerlaea sp.]|nr:MAG: hypothetical protein KatS3mg130_1057 [Candidatus Sumerlaea sp.]
MKYAWRWGAMGASLLKSGDRVLTHCNAGGLATARYGTALAAVYYAVHHEGKHIEVFADENPATPSGGAVNRVGTHGKWYSSNADL